MTKNLRDLEQPHSEYPVKADWDEQISVGEPRYAYWRDVDTTRRGVHVYSSGDDTTYRVYREGLPLKLRNTVRTPGPGGLWWPVIRGLWMHPGDELVWSYALRGLPVAVVHDRDHDLYGLATVADGSADLSWHLAAAFLTCGFHIPHELGLIDWRYGRNRVGARQAARIRSAVLFRCRSEARRLRAKAQWVSTQWR